MLEEAVFHALLGQDYWLVAQIIERNTQKILAHGEFELALKWINALPKEVIYSRPWLQVFHARVCCTLNLTQEMEGVLLKLEQQLQEETNDNETEQIRANISYLRGMAAYREADLEIAINHAMQAQKFAGEEDLEFRNNLLMLLGSIQLDLGKLAKASSSFSNVINTLQPCSNLNEFRLLFAAMCNLGDIHIIQGELIKADDIYSKASKLAESWGDNNFHFLGRAFISIGNIKYEQNQLEAAKALIQKGIEHYEKWGHASDMAISYASMARVFQALGNLSEANAMMNKALLETNRSSIGIKAKQFVMHQQYCLRTEDDTTEAEKWLQENNIKNPEDININNEKVYFQWMHILFVKKEFVTASILLDKLVEVVHSSKRNGLLIELYILQALSWQAQNQSGKSFDAITKALQIAEPNGYIRIFVDEGDLMWQLLEEFNSAVEAGKIQVENQTRLSKYLDIILSSFAMDEIQKIKDIQSSPEIDPLTSRELEILRLICSGLSNREIGKKLYITNSTVKTHLHHIFEKVRVETRTQLIVRAKESNLI